MSQLTWKDITRAENPSWQSQQQSNSYLQALLQQQQQGLQGYGNGIGGNAASGYYFPPQQQQFQLPYQGQYHQQFDPDWKPCFYIGPFTTDKETYEKICKMGHDILESFPLDLEGEIQLTKFPYYAVTAFLKSGIPDAWQGFMAYSWREHPIVLVE